MTSRLYRYLNAPYNFGNSFIVEDKAALAIDSDVCALHTPHTPHTHLHTHIQTLRTHSVLQVVLHDEQKQGTR